MNNDFVFLSDSTEVPTPPDKEAPPPNLLIHEEICSEICQSKERFTQSLGSLSEVPPPSPFYTNTCCCQASPEPTGEPQGLWRQRPAETRSSLLRSSLNLCFHSSHSTLMLNEKHLMIFICRNHQRHKTNTHDLHKLDLCSPHLSYSSFCFRVHDEGPPPSRLHRLHLHSSVLGVRRQFLI